MSPSRIQKNDEKAVETESRRSAALPSVEGLPALADRKRNMSPIFSTPSLLILALAVWLLCPPARAVEVQARQVPPGTGWMALHGGGSASFWDNYAANFPNNFAGGFTAFGEVAAPAESGHRLTVLVNDCGWAVMVRFDCADAAAARPAPDFCHFPAPFRPQKCPLHTPCRNVKYVREKVGKK